METRRPINFLIFTIMSYIVNLTIKRGTTFGPYQIICKQADGTPFPLAGYSAEAQARERVSGEVVIDLAPTIQPDDALGIISLSEIPWEETAAMADELLKWDLILIDPNGKKIPPFVFGEITVTTPITQQS